MLCPTCNLEQPAGNRFCEDCGARMDGQAPAAPVPVITEPAVCPQCGAVNNAADGYCARCGFERKSLVEDHLEVAAPPNLAGVSDLGKVRARNEDFVALATENGIEVLVVCDGVSQSQQADRAAFAAAKCVRDALLKSDMRIALKAADAVVRAIPCETSHPAEPAETTIVAAIRRGNAVDIGWLGDSRAYWVDSNGMRQLTTDHSWVNQIVASGELTFEQAIQHPNAHGITRTLGGPANEMGGDEPSILQLEIGRDLNAPGWLLLCTDGFWDSHEDAGHLAAFVTERLGGFPPVAAAPASPSSEGKQNGEAGLAATVCQVARDLVDGAVQKRGHDNTTVGLMFVGKECAV
jgi:serine/threonine protein phosphatase PrpC